MKRPQFTLTLFALVAALALPATALATSSEEGYGGPNNVVSGVETGNDEGSPPSSPTTEAAGVSIESDSSDSSVLPFTGTDLAILGISGALLIGFGFGLRRLTRQPTQP